MAFKINHLHFKSPDPQKAAEWWVENLGAKITWAAKPPYPANLLLKLDGITLHMTSFVKDQARPQKYGLEHICLDTDDLDNALKKLKASGARLLEESTGFTGKKLFFFETPDGVLVEINPMVKK
ncbi:MAG: VOC family protein [Dehalococcoidia bacterium]|nr:VOC family protein [Dehalococcoidia bacterium]